MVVFHPTTWALISPSSKSPHGGVLHNTNRYKQSSGSLHPQPLFPVQPLVRSLVPLPWASLPFYKNIYCLVAYSSLSLSFFPSLFYCIYDRFGPSLFLCEMYFHWMEFLASPKLTRHPPSSRLPPSCLFLWDMFFFSPLSIFFWHLAFLLSQFAWDVGRDLFYLSGPVVGNHITISLNGIIFPLQTITLTNFLH